MDPTDLRKQSSRRLIQESQIGKAIICPELRRKPKFILKAAGAEGFKMGILSY
jgi:hypothetical protein